MSAFSRVWETGADRWRTLRHEIVHAVCAPLRGQWPAVRTLIGFSTQRFAKLDTE